MKKFAKFLKPFIVPIMIAVALLFLRAWTDLSLPNFMSDLVNTGVVSGGVDEDAPRSISENGMTLVTAFMTVEEREVFMAAYEQADVEADDGSVRAGYNRIEFDDPNVGLNYGRAAQAFVQFGAEMAKQSGSEITAGDASEVTIDLEQIYSMLPMLAQMPEGSLASYAQISTDDMTLSTQRQIGLLFTRAFYEDLGLDVTQIQLSYIWRIGLYMLLVSLLSVIANVLGGLLSSQVGAGFARDLRRAVFRKVESFSSKEFDKFSTASLLTRTTNDVTQMQMLVTMGLRMVLYAPIMGIGGIFMAIGKSPSLSWIIAGAVAVLMVIILVLYKVVVPKFTLMQELTDRINLVSRENLSGVMVIRAFGNERYEEDRFAVANENLTTTNRWIQRVMAMMMPMMTILMNAVSLLIVWVGGNAIANSTLQIGDMMAFTQYAIQIIMSFLMLAIMFIMVPRAAVSGRRILEVLDSENLINDPAQPRKLPASTTRIVEFKDVLFKYGRAKEPVLRGISFTAKPGETTAFIGATGSGKSTLVNLIPRFYDRTEGSITIDGVDIRDITLHDLRAEIGYIPQKGVLFSGTVADNIRYGDPDASNDEIAQALDTAQAAGFVNEFEEKTDHMIAQGGDNVSGGQRQRLSIARALAKKAPIYIFDDSFSALDFKTDAALRAALKNKTADATVLVVAQRVSTIMYAEQIIVLEDGEIVGKGTHRELLDTCPTYREIAESQLSKEEM